MELAEIGDVISAKTDDMLWKAVLHLVCSDGSYIVQEETINTVLEKSFKFCSNLENINTISISKLGTGYGTIKDKQFMNLLHGAVENIPQAIASTIFVCNISGSRH